MATNPFPADMARVLVRNEEGELVTRPADERSEAESFHTLFIHSSAVSVSATAGHCLSLALLARALRP